jgi:hypothetical protein
MNKKVMFVSLAICLLISACGAGAPPVPTTDPINIVNTAQAAAFTMIAETQAAIPTATFTETPLPTPIPTDTPVPLPTLPPTSIVQPTATTASSSNSNDCYHPIEVGAGGPTSVLRIKNKTGGPITVFVYLWKKNAHGECGYTGFDLAKGDSSTLTTMPRGYFAVTAYTNNRKKTAYGEAIVSDDHLIDFEVYDDWIKVIYP